MSNFDAEAQQVTASKGLAQGPYVASKARFKFSTFQTKDVKSTNEPTCPTMISLQCFRCFIICLLRHYSISSMLPLFYYLFITSPLCSTLRLPPLFVASLDYIFKVFSVLLSVCYVTILSLQCFHCFIICLLRHCSVRGFGCYFLCLLRH